MKWIGEGIHERDDIDKIIKFTTALECLLIGSNGDKSKTESLAERCAFLLEEKDACKRYKIFSDIKGNNGLYSIRSKLVHDGELDEGIDINIKVYELRNLAIRCLFKVISLSTTPKINKIQDVIDWVDKLKMKCYYQED